MRQRMCDRCGGKIIDEKERFRIVVMRPEQKGVRGKDLCPKCFEAYMDFMANKGGKIK